jgi:hypothetical protein
VFSVLSVPSVFQFLRNPADLDAGLVIDESTLRTSDGGSSGMLNRRRELESGGDLVTPPVMAATNRDGLHAAVVDSPPVGGVSCAGAGSSTAWTGPNTLLALSHPASSSTEPWNRERLKVSITFTR